MIYNIGMSQQIIGIILLIAAVATGLYVSSHYMELTSFKIALPQSLRLVPGPDQLSLSPAQPSDSQVSSESQKPVSISYINPASESFSYMEMALASNAGPLQVTDITGWMVKSRSGRYFTVPKAQEVYSFGGAQTDIILKSGDALRMYSGDGPRGNFRMNKCMGYLEDQTPFTPSIPMSCPAVSRAETVNFTSECQDYAASLRVCENPNANPPVPISDAGCFEVLRKLNYVGCVERYGRDEDFLNGEWWAWMGDQMNIFDPVHDKVQLLDKNGRLIDEYAY